MNIIQTQKFIRVSPRKLREVSDLARGMSPNEAIEKLPFTGKRAADPLIKVIKTAIANAKDRQIPTNELTIKEIQIGEGPRLKRGRPVSRGRWHPYQRKMSHIRVVLETKDAAQGAVAAQGKKQAVGRSKVEKVLEKPSLLKKDEKTKTTEAQKGKDRAQKSGILGKLAGREKGGAKARQVQERGGG